MRRTLRFIECRVKRRNGAIFIGTKPTLTNEETVISKKVPASKIFTLMRLQHFILK